MSESANEKAEDLLEEVADAADTYASRLRKKYEDTKESITDEAPEFVTQVWCVCALSLSSNAV